MLDSVTIWYRGAGYQLGRGPRGYAIWPAGRPPVAPLEQWPETPAGWSAAWARFNAVEAPGSIVHLGPPPGPAPAPHPGWPPAGPAWAGLRSAGPLTAAIALAAGVAFGVAGLFPAYLSGTGLAQEPAELVPHVIYLAVWTASAVLIVSGGLRQRIGALLALGLSIVTLGFFFADLGAVISGGAHVMGPGLALGLAGWLACAAGSVLAFRLRAADGPRTLDGRQPGPALTLTIAALAAIGTAVAFAPSWDRYTLRAASGVTQTLTAGNAFANPAAVIVGDVAVMVTLVAVVIVAALWRPARLGAVLLAGAAIPMAAQAISALVQVSEPVSPASFGISPAQARQAGITISTGLTAAFWIYCAFVVALLMIGAWMGWPARSASRLSARPGGMAFPGAVAPGAVAPGAVAPGAVAPGTAAPGAPAAGPAGRTG